MSDLTAATTPVPTRQARRRVVAAFMIPLGYMSVRAVVYAHYPQVSSFDWYRRDFAMTLPRLACFGLALTARLAWWRDRPLGLNLRGLKLMSIFCAAEVAVMFLGPRIVRADIPSWQFLVWFGVVTIPVALSEETVFRVTLFLALRDWHGTKTAIVISSIAFALWHVQAKPLVCFPNLFAFGLLYAILRSKNVSVLWLMLWHWLVDTLIFLPGFDPDRPLIALVQLLIFGGTAWFLWTLPPVGVSPPLAATQSVAPEDPHGDSVSGRLDRLRSSRGRRRS